MNIKIHPIEKVNINKVKELSFNRTKSESHVRVLSNSIANVGVLRTPVFVRTKAINGKTEIYNVDGQHLVESLKRMDVRSVDAIVVETESVSQIVNMMAVLNNVQQKWTVLDYVNAYCGLGNSDYYALKQHALGNGFAVTLSATILSGTTAMGKGLNDVRKGKFKITAEDTETVTKNVIEVSNTVGNNGTKFQMAYISFYRSNSKNYKHDEFIEKIKDNQEMFEDLPHDTKFISNLFYKLHKNE
jgi:uncharacterized ParB-like nuclease family protein